MSIRTISQCPVCACGLTMRVVVSAPTVVELTAYATGLVSTKPACHVDLYYECPRDPAHYGELLKGEDGKAKARAQGSKESCAS